MNLPRSQDTGTWYVIYVFIYTRNAIRAHCSWRVRGSVTISVITRFKWAAVINQYLHFIRQGYKTQVYNQFICSSSTKTFRHVHRAAARNIWSFRSSPSVCTGIDAEQLRQRYIYWSTEIIICTLGKLSAGGLQVLPGVSVMWPYPRTLNQPTALQTTAWTHTFWYQVDMHRPVIRSHVNTRWSRSQCSRPTGKSYTSPSSNLTFTSINHELVFLPAPQLDSVLGLWVVLQAVSCARWHQMSACPLPPSVLLSAVGLMTLFVWS